LADSVDFSEFCESDSFDGFGSTTMLAAWTGLHHAHRRFAGKDDRELDDSATREAIGARYPSLRTACELIQIRQFDNVEAT
jgi:hypothetical protein